MVNEEHSILKELIENFSERFSIRKLSKIRKINYKSAYNALMKLKDKGLVNLEKIGNTIICSFSKKFNDIVFSVEYGRRKSLLKNKDFRVIYDRLFNMKFPFIALIFGSYAKGNYSKHSDIDILFVIPDEKFEKEIKQEINLIPLKIHSTIFTCREFLSMVKSKEFSVVSEAVKKNIILIGIEDYYRLIGDKNLL